jgi:hypothetical protein
MVKKLTKSKKGLVLEIDQAVADALGISKPTDIEMLVLEDMLIIKPRKLSKKKRKAKLANLTQQLMDKYEPVLKKLAKT